MKIAGIINLKEKRGLHNIALAKETLFTHRGEKERKTEMEIKQTNIMETKLTRITELSKEKSQVVFTSIYHLLNKDLLKICHKELEGKKATGLDGVTKAMYEENLEENIEQLEQKLQRLSYKPTPARRVYIPKANGKTRGLAIATYEDKIVQLALKKIIEAIYEPKLTNTMYGFRPNRSCHDAIKDLNRKIEKGKVSYIVDADIKGFFDHIDHEWLIRCVEQHIRDPRIIRLIKRFLRAGIIEKTEYKETTEGTPQGSILSPVLANIYMHYILALWFEKIIQRKFKGESYITIYADDFVCCFQYKKEAEIFMNKLLPERLRKFKLEIAEDKTRLIQFGRFAKTNRTKGKVETFDFLGFTHYCSENRYGKFRVKRKTAKKKFAAKVQEFKEWIKRNRHMRIKDLIANINIKLRGHYRYFGVTDNSNSLRKFRQCIYELLKKWINRRSQKKSYTTEQFKQLMKTYPLIYPKIYVDIYG